MGYVFIDESGDPGRTFDRENPTNGSSENLIFAAVYFDSKAASKEWSRLHRQWKIVAGRGRAVPPKEFKWTSSGDRRKEDFLSYALQATWKYRAFVLRKDVFWGNDSPEDVYRKHAGYLLNNVARISSHGSSVFIDDRSYGAGKRRMFRSMVLGPMRLSSPGCAQKFANHYTKMSFVDSKRSAGVQLADFLAGALCHGYRTWKQPRRRFMEAVSSRGEVQVWPNHS